MKMSLGGETPQYIALRACCHVFPLVALVNPSLNLLGFPLFLLLSVQYIRSSVVMTDEVESRESQVSHMRARNQTHNKKQPKHKSTRE